MAATHTPWSSPSGSPAPMPIMVSGKKRRLDAIEKEDSDLCTASWRNSRRLTPRWRMTLLFGPLQIACLLILAMLGHSEAAFVNFENCLSPSITNSPLPQLLQFVPLFAWVSFNATAPSHNLNYTVYGNVAGIATQQLYPNETDPQWRNPNETVGKIPDLGGNPGEEKYTTFSTALKVLGYVPYNPPDTRLCNTSALTSCPFTPHFNFTGNA